MTRVDDALEAADKLGYPVIIRAAYTLGGQGSGFCNNEDELRKMATKHFPIPPRSWLKSRLKDGKKLNMRWYGIVMTIASRCATWRILIRWEFIPVKASW